LVVATVNANGLLGRLDAAVELANALAIDFLFVSEAYLP
jgi:hypothetical protein